MSARRRAKLTLHPQKTRAVAMGSDGFDFLGFHFQKTPFKRTGHLRRYAWLSQKARKAVRAKIRQQTERNRLRVASMGAVPEEAAGAARPVAPGGIRGAGAAKWLGVLLPDGMVGIVDLHAVGRRLPVSRTKENLVYGLMRRGGQSRTRVPSVTPRPYQTDGRAASQPAAETDR